METIELRLLASDNNHRGDLFTRLSKDLLFALGYDSLRCNVHKSGRELDIQGEHRFESRRVVAECKATAAPIGGDDLNKFLGVLTRERSRCAPEMLAGYFISLAGFKESAVEQERESREAGVILIDADRIVSELERSRAIVAREFATERAGHCARAAGVTDAAVDGLELLGHELGYLWVVYYARGKRRTHLALIHADGTPLAESVANAVIAADQACGGSLADLIYLPPRTVQSEHAAHSASALSIYRHWIAEEYGFVHLDGLPADADLSSTRLKLERLYVPARVGLASWKKIDSDESFEPKSVPMGQLLREGVRLAVLAPPGGGKSTLLKRLATAYAFSERRAEVRDELPEVNWLPVTLRCRELRDRVARPILDILDDIPKYSGMTYVERDAFRRVLHESMLKGDVLLLIDGLDEVADESARQIFASCLRTFVSMFPKVALVVTSREAGFRLVAGTIASVCQQVTLAPLAEEEAGRLAEQWHVEVAGDTTKARDDARELVAMIWSDDRLHALAENPLLLTTLFVVKRWIGAAEKQSGALS